MTVPIDTTPIDTTMAETAPVPLIDACLDGKTTIIAGMNCTSETPTVAEACSQDINHITIGQDYCDNYQSPEVTVGVAISTSLPETGTSETVAIGAIGASMLLVGAALCRMRRRPA